MIWTRAIFDPLLLVAATTGRKAARIFNHRVIAFVWPFTVRSSSRDLVVLDLSRHAIHTLAPVSTRVIRSCRAVPHVRQRVDYCCRRARDVIPHIFCRNTISAQQTRKARPAVLVIVTREHSFSVSPSPTPSPSSLSHCLSVFYDAHKASYEFLLLLPAKKRSSFRAGHSSSFVCRVTPSIATQKAESR